jgi:elongation factor G
MQREFGVGANVGRPQVAYRETIRGTAEAEGRFIRQTGGHGQYGDVYLRVEPLADASAIEFVDAIKSGAVPREYISAVEKGVREALEAGVLAGYPLAGIQVTLFDGSYHDVDSSEMAFKIAGSMGVRQAAQKAKPVLMEPVMSVEVVVPEEYMGDIIGDLSSRRGRIEGLELRGTSQIIKARVPLAQMFGYATAMRSLTQGRGSFTMHFGRYEEVPSAMAEEIISKVQGKVMR